MHLSGFNRQQQDDIKRLVDRHLVRKNNGNGGNPGGGGEITDGDKGDVVVSNTGATWTIESGAVSTSKLGGDITAAGKALLTDATNTAQRATLGLGTAATSNTGDFAASSHSHAISDVTNLQNTLNGKADSAHSHSISDVTGLAATLSTFAPSTHSHPLSQLQAGAATSGQVVRFTDAINGWQPATLAISDTSGLQTELNGKANTSHTHAASDITSGLINTARLATGTANSTTYLRGDNVWASVAGGSSDPLVTFPSVKPIVGSFLTTAVMTDASTSLAGTANALDLAPLRLRANTTISTVDVNVTTFVASTTIRIAVYASNADGWPTGAPLAQSSVINTNANGIRSSAFSVTLNASQQYWLAIWFSGAPTIRSIPVGGMYALGFNNNGTAHFNKIRYTGVTYGTSTAFQVFSNNPSAANLVSGAMPMICLTVA